jgi:hypothetical protein
VEDTPKTLWIHKWTFEYGTFYETTPRILPSKQYGADGAPTQGMKCRSTKVFISYSISYTVVAIYQHGFIIFPNTNGTFFMDGMCNGADFGTSARRPMDYLVEGSKF